LNCFPAYDKRVWQLIFGYRQITMIYSYSSVFAGVVVMNLLAGSIPVPYLLELHTAIRATALNRKSPEKREDELRSIWWGIDSLTEKHSTYDVPAVAAIFCKKQGYFRQEISFGIPRQERQRITQLYCCSWLMHAVLKNHL
jgi:hypothetical protein